MDKKDQNEETAPHDDIKLVEKDRPESMLSISPHTDGISSSPKNYYFKFRNPNIKLEKKCILCKNFEIESRYEIIDSIGQGAYGITVTAKDTQKGNEYVAIKKIEKTFEHQVFLKRTLREVKVQRLLNHENILSLKTLFLPKSREEFQNVYVCSPLMETDLGSIIRSPQPLSNEHIQFFIYQVLRGLKYLHNAGIVHTDLKPRNLLVNSNCDVKICDFALAEFTHFRSKKAITRKEFLCARWYRAPEKFLTEGEESTFANDIWSAGCILAELITRRPFFPGRSSTDHLDLIFDIFGTPTEDFINTLKEPKTREYLRSLEQRSPRKFESLFHADTDPLALDLLEKMLKVDWRERITVEGALRHPYLKELHYPYDEPIREPINELEFEYEKYSLSIEQLKDVLYEEILLYHFEDFQAEYNKKIKAGESPFKEVIENANLKGNKEDSDDDID